MSTPKKKPMALSAFGRIVGVTEGAVRGGIRSGRLERSLTLVHGRAKVGDLALALVEWRDNLNVNMTRGPRS